jgi:hypothetical protein
MTVTTSKPSPVVIGNDPRSRETVYTATRTTKMADGTYSVEMIQYSNALGQGGRVIAERDGVNNWNFKDGVDNKLKQNENKLNKASMNQMESMRGNFVQNAQEAEEYNRSQGQPNVATTDENEGGSQPSGEQSKPAPGVNKGIKGTGGIYPEDIGNTKQDVIKFDMLEYRPSKFEDRPSVDTADIIETVILAVPGGIQDQNIANWNSETMDPLQKAAAKAAFNVIGEGDKGVNQAIADAKSAFENGGGEMKQVIQGIFAGKAAGVGNQVFQRGQGQVMNPNMELLFNGPSLRQFSFNFLLAPRSESEQQQVVNIIRFFKQGMSPIKSEANLFLRSPNTFRLRYIHRQSGDDSEHKFLTKFKECALTNTGVNYTPNNNYATFPDGGMVAYQLTLSFQELEPIFNNDYAEVKEGIGY